MANALKNTMPLEMCLEHLSKHIALINGNLQCTEVVKVALESLAIFPGRFDATLLILNSMIEINRKAETVAHQPAKPKARKVTGNVIALFSVDKQRSSKHVHRTNQNATVFGKAVLMSI